MNRYIVYIAPIVAPNCTIGTADQYANRERTCRYRRGYTHYQLQYAEIATWTATTISIQSPNNLYLNKIKTIIQIYLKANYLLDWYRHQMLQSHQHATNAIRNSLKQNVLWKQMEYSQHVNKDNSINLRSESS